MSQANARSERESAPNVIVLGPGQGRTIPGPEGLTLKASGEETGGALGFHEATTPPGFGPPRHIHYGCDELFYVLEGEFDFLLGDRIVRAAPGTSTSAASLGMEDVELTLREHSGTEGFQQLLRPSSLEG